MTVAAEVKLDTLQDLVERLGNIPLSRVRLDPPPGLATEADVLEAEQKQNKLCELVDGVLVEKAMGYRESLLAVLLGHFLLEFVAPRNLGLVSGPDGSVRLFPGLVRVPDVAFATWDRFPDRQIPKEPIPTLAPDLVVEMLSESNTKAEMLRKRGEYFSSGVRLIWEIDPEPRMVTVYTPDGGVTMLDCSQTLDGADVLPGFSLTLSELFSKLEQAGMRVRARTAVLSSDVDRGREGRRPMTVTAPVKHGNLQELLDRLGNIPPSRVWLDPLPGLATEDDVLEAERTQNRLCELVDGVLVEKGMGYGESVLACAMIEILRRFVKPRKLGVVSGADGMIRLFAGLIRIPDVSFASWDRFPNRKIPKSPVPALAPELVVEILSESNTAGRDGAEAGRVFRRPACGWSGKSIQYPERLACYTADGSVKMLDASQTLEGGDVLPGFSLVLSRAVRGTG